MTVFWSSDSRGADGVCWEPADSGNSHLFHGERGRSRVGCDDVSGFASMPKSETRIRLSWSFSSGEVTWLRGVSGLQLDGLEKLLLVEIEYASCGLRESFFRCLSSGEIPETLWFLTDGFVV